MPNFRLPCARCSGTGADTHEDRHAETNMDICRECGGTGLVASETGETRAGSFDHRLGRAPGDRVAQQD
jgi:DnaJ-class molecular chaperone